MSVLHKSYWHNICLYWQHLGSPLRPSCQDLQIIQRSIDAFHKAPQNIRLLLFGVTQELLGLDWPITTQITAVEKSSKMIELLWKEHKNNRQVICGDWLRQSFSQKFNLVLGDGIFCSLNPQQQQSLFAKAYDFLETEGLCIFRLFVLDNSKNTQELFDQLWTNEMANFHLFKIRLAMSLQNDPQQGVKLASVFDVWDQANIHVEKLAAQTGWKEEEINTISIYENKDTVYYFSTQDDYLKLAEDYFEVVDICVPDYDGGTMFPTVVLKKKC